MNGNILKVLRIIARITITELSHFSKVSTKVISQTERLLRGPSEVTKRKILNVLNMAKNQKEKPYSFEYVFLKRMVTKAVRILKTGYMDMCI